MTDKMKIPEVGRPYKSKDGYDFNLTHINKDEIRLLESYEYVGCYKRMIYVNPHYFWDYFEEAEEKPPLGLKPKKIHDELRRAEIKAAMERYSEASKLYPAEWLLELDQLEIANGSNIPEKADCVMSVDEGKPGGDKTIYTVREGHKILYCGEENPFPEEKPKSIWKPVKDLPEKSCSVYLKWTDGEILLVKYNSRYEKFILPHTELDANDSRLKEYCALTDFINDYEQLKQRIEKLEEK